MEQLNDIERLFKLLTDWRCFPNYQLERRADIFFGLYMRSILGDLLQEGDVIGLPEFPLRTWFVKERKTDPITGEEVEKEHWLTVKADYLCISINKPQLVLVELKTEELSVGSEQLNTMIRAADRGFSDLMQDLLEVSKRSRQSQKYDRYFEELSKVRGSINAPLISRTNGEWVLNKEVAGCYEKIQCVIIKPTLDTSKWNDKQREKIQVITFDDVDNRLKDEGELAQAFRKILRLWKAPC